MKTTNKTIRIRLDLAERLARAAEIEHTTQSALIVRAILAELRRVEQ